jgi:hypothetical protein
MKKPSIRIATPAQVPFKRKQSTPNEAGESEKEL